MKPQREHAFDQPMHPVQIAGFRRMPVVQKWEMMAQMRRFAIEMKSMQLRKRHPEWSAEDIDLAARKALLHAGTDPYCHFIDPLEATGLPYCVTGSLASGSYGEFRLTADIDLVVLLRVEDIGKFCAVFPEADYYVPPFEVLISEIRRGSRGMFNLIHQKSQFKADIFVATRDPLHQWALAHRRRVDMQGGEVWVCPPEYVILKKLEYYREGGSDKHTRDIRFMLACTDVDSRFLEVNVERLGLHAQWAECQLPQQS